MAFRLAPVHLPRSLVPGLPFSTRTEALLQSARIVLGLLGGIGAGKSYVARKIASVVPASIVDADELAHEVLATVARDGRLAEAVGPDCVRPDGTADRRTIAKKVFADAAALRALERLTHPAISALIHERVQDHHEGRGPTVLVLDVPLLIEVGLDRMCNALWFVDAPESVRHARAAKNGLALEEVKRRESHQSPLERKRARADLVIRNDGDEVALERQIREGLAALC